MFSLFSTSSFGSGSIAAPQQFSQASQALKGLRPLNDRSSAPVNQHPVLEKTLERAVSLQYFDASQKELDPAFPISVSADSHQAVVILRPMQFQKQAQVDRIKAINQTLTTPDLSTASNIPGANVLGSQAAADATNPFSMADLNPPSINQTALDQANNPPMVKEQNPFDTTKVAQTPVEKVGDLASYADEFKKYIGTDPNRAALEERLSKMDTKAAEEERVAPWMALAQAGFGMAAGKSPYALTNIGEGALAGVKSYGEAKDKLDQLEEKRFGLSNDLAKSQRAETIAEAEYGAKSKEAAKTRALTAEVHNKSNDNALKIAKIQASVAGGNKLIAAKDKIEDNVRAKLKDLISAGTISISSPEEYDRIFKKMLSETYQQYGIAGAPAVPTNTVATLQPATKGSGAQYRFGY